MKSSPLFRWVLAIGISVLALTDGVLHFALDYVLFHGKLWGSAMPGPPRGAPGPGGPPPGPPPANPLLSALDISRITGLPLNELFVLNAVGYAVLVLVFWLWPRRLRAWRWLVDVALIGYTAASIIGWLDIGRPNPNGLGYLSKAIEVALIALLLVHLWVGLSNRESRSRGTAARRF